MSLLFLSRGFPNLVSCRCDCIGNAAWSSVDFSLQSVVYWSTGTKRKVLAEAEAKFNRYDLSYLCQRHGAWVYCSKEAFEL